MFSKFRRYLHRQLDPEAWPTNGFSPLNWMIIVAIWVSIIFGVLATEPKFTTLFGGGLLLADRIILGFFAVEYIARFATAGLNPKFRGVVGLLKYATRPVSIADLIVILPIFLAASPTWVTIFRLLRILRLIRLAAMPRIHDAIEEFIGALAAKKFEFLLTFSVAIILVLFSSTALYLLEGEHQPAEFGSIPRSIWWSIVTFTTVGYGDAVPITPMGRFFAGFFAICGVGLVAMLTGIIASALGDAAERHARKKEIFSKN